MHHLSKSLQVLEWGVNPWLSGEDIPWKIQIPNFAIKSSVEMHISRSKSVLNSIVPWRTACALRLKIITNNGREYGKCTTRLHTQMKSNTFDTCEVSFRNVFPHIAEIACENELTDAALAIWLILYFMRKSITHWLDSHLLLTWDNDLIASQEDWLLIPPFAWYLPDAYCIDAIIEEMKNKTVHLTGSVKLSDWNSPARYGRKRHYFCSIIMSSNPQFYSTSGSQVAPSIHFLWKGQKLANVQVGIQRDIT